MKAYKIINVEQGTPDWLSLRENYIGASEAPVIMGVSPYETPYQLWERRVGLKPPIEQTEAMRRGHEDEPLARKWAESSFLFKSSPIELPPAVLVSLTNPWMLASLDGFNEEAPVCAEFKSIKMDYHEMVRNGQCPEIYFPQLQHQAEVAGVAQVLLVSYKENDTVGMWVQRNDSYIAEMVEKERLFMECVKTFTPPPLTDRDYIPMEGRSWSEMEGKLLESKTQSDYWRLEYERLKEQAWETAGKRNAKGKQVTLTGFMKKGNVDYKIIPELDGVDLEPYRKESSYQYRLTFGKEVKDA